MLNNLVPTDGNQGSDNNLFVFFRLNEKVYAINTSHTIEVLKLMQIEYPEKLPNYIIGLLNYNNFTINVIDLRLLLDLELKDYNVHNELLVVKTQEAIFAIVVDEVIDIKSIPANEMQLIPYKSNNNLIKMIYQKDNNLVSIVDLYSIEKVLKENEFTQTNYNYSKLFPSDEKSKNILVKRNNDLAQKIQLGVSPELYNHEQFILLELNRSIYCINIKFVNELVKLKNISMPILPFAPSYIQGVINLRGEFITVLNIKEFLNIDSSSDAEPKDLIVVEYENCKIGIVVDKIHQIKNIACDDLLIKPSNKSRIKYVMAEVVEEETVYNVLNIEKIFNDEKMFVSVE